MTDFSQTSRVTSRRAKVEQSKLLQQTLIFGGLGVIFLIVGVFIIIPWFIRTMGGLDTGLQVNNIEGVLPQPPRLDAPVPATFSANLVIRGVSDKGNEVTLWNNNAAAGGQMIDEDGIFEIPINLEKGENVLTATAIDPNKKESVHSTPFTVVFDNEPPKLEVAEPTDQQTVQGKKNQSLTIKGSSDPKSKMYFNDRMIFAQEDGSFSTVHRLENGDNTIVLKAVDQAGNQTEKIMTVKFSE